LSHAPRFPVYLGAAIFVAIVSPLGCSTSEEPTSSGSGSTGEPSTSASTGGEGGAGGTGATTTTTTTTSSASSSSGGGEGGGGGAPPVAGKPGTETVSAGEQSTSPNYRMVFTFGQPTQNQGKTTSPGYRMQGGLQGANGSLP
jgi:hypothetical protein